MWFNDGRVGYTENLINIKQRERSPIILRKYMRKYGKIGASYTDDLGRRLEALYTVVHNGLQDMV